MRTIKFRAWDTNKKEMRDVTSINWYDGYLWVDETPMTGHKLPIEGTPLMQFTGLLDKNGVEIFEGDVVKRDARKYVVKECEASFRLAEGENPGGFLLGDCAPITLEVIGNIHENGDLLKCN